MSETTAARPVVLIDQDYGDSGIVVVRHPDGMLTLDLNDQRIILTLAAFDELAGAFQLARFRAQDLQAGAEYAAEAAAMEVPEGEWLGFKMKIEEAEKQVGRNGPALWAVLEPKIVAKERRALMRAALANYTGQEIPADV